MEIDRTTHAALREGLTAASDEAWILYERYAYPKRLFLVVGHIQNALRELKAYEEVLACDGDPVAALGDTRESDDPPMSH